MAGIKLLQNVILSQWTGLYKLDCNGFAGIQTTELLCDVAKHFNNKSS